MKRMEQIWSDLGLEMMGNPPISYNGDSEGFLLVDVSLEFF